MLAVMATPRAQPPSTAVTPEQLLAGASDPARWLMFAGDYSGRRHSPLTQVTPQNVSRLAHQWTFQTGTLGMFETTPIVHDGVLYLTGANNLAWAVDARTGRAFWRYRRELPEDLRVCCGPVNRGFAALGNRLFMTTLDAHLVALDARTGAVLFDVMLDDYKKGYASTLAPLVVKNTVIVGVAGGEYGAPGFIDAYDVETGRRVWRHNTVPAPGQPGQRNLAGRFGRARRRRRVGHRQLRSRAEPGVLRDRQSVARLSRRGSQRRQPVQQFAAGARCRPPARAAGTISSRPTTPTTGTRPTCRSWPI